MRELFSNWGRSCQFLQVTLYSCPLKLDWTYLQVYLQYVVKCAFDWDCIRSRGLPLKLSNSIPIKASPFTPIHNLEHQPGPDAMLSHFFLLFSYTFVSPFSSHLFFVHFLLAWGSEDILSYLTCLAFLEWPDLCNRVWFCALFAIVCLHRSLLPFYSSFHLNQRLAQLIHT